MIRVAVWITRRHIAANMCGIAGIVSTAAVNSAPVGRMLRCLIHRGPDESGVWTGDGCVLGHQRLSIIDLSATGSQPMCDESGRFVLVFNGEIFNFRRLREELSGAGFEFRGTSDTEVLLRGYQAWGDALPGKLLGMFAFAIWDTEKKRLFAARDRYGKKPFFYSGQNHNFVFASEVRAILHGLGRVPDTCPTGFASYLRFGYVPGTGTTYRNIFRLAPSHYLVWENGQFRSHAYHAWPPPQRGADEVRSEHGQLDRLEECLRGAIEDRLVSDVPLGCFLSGGIDSSLVVALARQIVGPSLKTFTVSFPGSTRDEGRRARLVARALHVDHRQIDISESSMEDGYLKTLQAATEPIGDDSLIPTFFISRATREYVTVALSGDGGDELFGGYPKYHQIHLASRLRMLGAMTPAAIDTWLPDAAAKALGLFRSKSPAERALWLGSLWKPVKLRCLLRDPQTAEAGRLFFENEWVKCGGRCLQDQFCLTDIATYLEGDILTKVDRASMLASLEVRSPFLDERILDFTCATSLRCGPLGQSKLALKKLLARHLDPRIFGGPKKGFGCPIDEWLRGGLRPVLEEYTSAARLRSEGLVDVDFVAWVKSEHLSGRRNYGRKLHALIAWEVWREQIARDDFMTADGP